jgi:predicted protein tyrosine phosphatase
MTNVLFICTANLERSPTAEMVFKDYPGWNVRSAGTSPYAVTPVSTELLAWADHVIVMRNIHLEKILEISPSSLDKTKVLHIEDRYHRCSSELIGTLIINMSKLFPLDTWLQSKFRCH